MKKLIKLLLAITISIALIQTALAVSSVARSKNILQHIRKHNAAPPSNVQVDEIAMAFLYHPASRSIITQYLEQQSLALNPADETVLEDIGTLNGGVFTPANPAIKNQYESTIYRRNLRKYHTDVMSAYLLRTANAPALPIKEARASIISTAKANAAAIVGDNTDDPEN